MTIEILSQENQNLFMEFLKEIILEEESNYTSDKKIRMIENIEKEIKLGQEYQEFIEDNMQCTN